MGKRSELTPAQRCEAVLSLLRREEAAAKLARRLGVSEQTLYRCKAYREPLLPPHHGVETAAPEPKALDPPR